MWEWSHLSETSRQLPMFVSSWVQWIFMQWRYLAIIAIVVEHFLLALDFDKLKMKQLSVC